MLTKKLPCVDRYGTQNNSLLLFFLIVCFIDDTTNSNVVHASDVCSKCGDRLCDCSFVKNQSNSSVFIGEEMRPFLATFFI